MKRWQERRRKQDAQRAFLEALAKFANLEFLTAGQHGFDYSIEVPRGVEVHQFEKRLIEMELDIFERFGVRVRAWAVTGEYPEAPGWQTKEQVSDGTSVATAASSAPHQLGGRRTGLGSPAPP